MSNGKNRLSVLRGLAVGIHILVTVLSVVVCAVGIYIRVQFPAEKLDELWFYLTGGVGEGGTGAVGSAAAVLVLPCLAVSALLLHAQAMNKMPVRAAHLRLRKQLERPCRLFGNDEPIGVFDQRIPFGFFACIGRGRRFAAFLRLCQ